MLSLIVAKAKNNIIGKDHKILWNLPDDLRRFEEITNNHTIIMGRKRFETLGEVVSNRKYIVFSRNPDFNINNENVKIIKSLTEVQEYIENDEENFVIGGAMIYNLLMPYIQKMYVTEIEKEYEGDTFFPVIKEEKWKEISREKHKDEKQGIFYSYVEYIRRK